MAESVAGERIDANQGNKDSLEYPDQDQDEDGYVSDKGASSLQTDSEQESDLSEIESDEEEELEREPDHDQRVTDLPSGIEDQQEEGGLPGIDSERESVSGDTIDEGDIESRPRTAWPQQREHDSQGAEGAEGVVGVVGVVDKVDEVDLVEELARQLL